MGHGHGNLYEQVKLPRCHYHAVSKILLNIISQTHTKYLNLTNRLPWNIHVCQSWTKPIMLWSSCPHVCKWGYHDLIWSTSPKWVWKALLWCKIERSHLNYPHKKEEKQQQILHCKLFLLNARWCHQEVLGHNSYRCPAFFSLCVAVISWLEQTAYLCMIEEKHNHCGHWHSEKTGGYLMILDRTCFVVGCESTAMVSGKATPMMTDWCCKLASWKRESSSQDCHGQRALTAAMARLTALWGTKQVVLRLFLANRRLLSIPYTGLLSIP